VFATFHSLTDFRVATRISRRSGGLEEGRRTVPRQ
jgi:hypothetical protein